MEFLKQKLGLLEYITNESIDDNLKSLLDDITDGKVKDLICLPEFFSINTKKDGPLNPAKALLQYMKRTYKIEN